MAPPVQRDVAQGDEQRRLLKHPIHVVAQTRRELGILRLAQQTAVQPPLVRRQPAGVHLSPRRVHEDPHDRVVPHQQRTVHRRETDDVPKSSEFQPVDAPLRLQEHHDAAHVAERRCDVQGRAASAQVREVIEAARHARIELGAAVHQRPDGSVVRRQRRNVQRTQPGEVQGIDKRHVADPIVDHCLRQVRTIAARV